MMIIYVRLITCFLLCGLLPGLAGYAQAQPNPFPLCGTPDLPPAQLRDLVREADEALRQKQESAEAGPPITYVPIRPHILRKSDGSGGISLTLMNQVMALTNSYYLQNGSGIQFFFAGTTPDYIDNDAQYTSFSDENAVANGRDATNAMNQYYVNAFASGVGGYAYFPFNSISSTRSFILNERNAEDMGNRLVPHELGHNFNLSHTFGGSGGTRELVTRGSGANCLSQGDFLCDTPADPYTIAGANVIKVNGCPVYDPNSTARDANGAAYAPSITNIMSYYFPCTHDFTPNQYSRIQAALALRQSHTAYSLNAPPTVATAPGNLTGTVSGSSIALTWQDNATNEMGYFVERSTSAATGFLPIGGVGPNGTTFTDTKTAVNITYYYRVYPSNTTTAAYSPLLAIARATPVTGLNTTNISAGSARLNWTSAGSGVNYTVQWRLAGTTPWNTINPVQSTMYVLTGLSGGLTYEWQVRVAGGTTYAGPVQFITLCPVPTLTLEATSTTSATVRWTIPGQPAQPSGYVLRYRPTGTPSWTVVSGLTTSTYSLTNLTSNTSYEVQVATVCSPTQSSAFSPSLSVSTCGQPYSLRAGAWNDPATWSCNRVPSGTDVVQIKHIVNVPAGYTAAAGTVRYDAGKQLIFGLNAKLKLGQ